MMQNIELIAIGFAVAIVCNVFHTRAQNKGKTTQSVIFNVLYLAGVAVAMYFLLSNIWGMMSPIFSGVRR